VLPLLVPTETAVSTRTYVNTLAVQQLAVEAILKRPKDHYLADAPAKLYAYLGDWRDRLTELGDVLNETRRLLLVGRGSSYATAAVGALVIKEAAKFHAEGMTAGQFRHGPFELADRDLTVVLIDGNEGTASLTEGLAKDLSRLGARALWMGRDSVDSAWNVPTPDVWGIARPIGEIVPVQLMSVTLAVANGHEAGTFRHLQKVTVTE
jgi:glucosamine--fructose-6-phosphate aminotransferase (isomerizing)